MANLKQVQGGVHINNNLTYTPGSSYIFSIDCDSSSSYAMLVDDEGALFYDQDMYMDKDHNGKGAFDTMHLCNYYIY